MLDRFIGFVNQSVQRRCRMNLPHTAIVKSPGLLPMLYKVSEIAEELHVNERTLRDWLTSGAPHQRDERNNLWVNGRLFAEWVQAQRKPKKPAHLADNQAYCLRCKAVVELTNPEIIPIKGKLINIKGSCPQCGCVINRGGRHGRTG
jgi:hypothetical protein